MKIKQYILAMLICMGSVIAASEPSTKPLKTAMISTTVYGHAISYPMAPWQLQDILKGKMGETYRDEASGNFIFEVIPAGESFNKWTKLYAIHGFKLSKKNRSIPLSTFVDEQTQLFKDACEEVYQETYEETKDGILTVLACGEIKGSGSKKSSSEGEVYVGYWYKSDKAVISIYHEWKGKAFDVKDHSTWPVTEVELDEMKQQLKRVSISSA